MIDGALVPEVCRDDLLDNLFHDLLPEVLGRNIVRVLGGNDDGVNSKGDNGTTVALVLDRHLGLGIRSKPGKSTGPSGHCESLVQFVSEDDGEGHQLWSFGGGISEHETLIASAEALEGAVVKTLSDIGRLLLNCDEDVAGLVVKTLFGVVVTDFLDGVSNDLLVVDLGLCGDFTEDHDHSGLSSGLAGDLGERVLFQAGIKL